MPSPIDPAKLIEHARELANHHQAQGRPRATLLRRASSAAYYALFHCIAEQAADELFSELSQDERLQITRSFSHDPIKRICGVIAGRKNLGDAPRHARDLAQSLTQTNIAQVAAAFYDLQDSRHAADYDHLAPISKAAALSHIQDAEQAIEMLTNASRRDRQAFFALLALGTSLR